MSRLNLNTSVRGNDNRYSFMATPHDMHPSFQFPDGPSPPEDSKESTEEAPRGQKTWSYAPSEKEEQFQQQGIMPSHDDCPPLEEHPANYAAFVNRSTQYQGTPTSPREAQHDSRMVTQYATAPGTQQHGAPIASQYATSYDSPGNQGHPGHAQIASPSYIQSYPSLPQHPVSPQSYSHQTYTTISDQGHVIMSPHGYNNNYLESQRGTPVSPQAYTYSQSLSYTTRQEPQPQDNEIFSQPHTYTEPPVLSPSSPDPFPLKERSNAPQINTINIAPDENPLQSPQASYFPPPTRTATAPEDLDTSHQPGQAVHPNQELTGGGWSNRLCELSSLGICCLGLICPCILYGRTQYRLSMKSRKEDPTNMLGYKTCNASCTGMGLLCGCQWLLATVQHTRVRKAYGIQGGIASDCVRATCCTCCTLIQDEKEIQKRENRARVARERGAALLSPYTPPLPMTYGKE